MESAVNLAAGGLSGMAVDFVLYPLDTLKTQLQAARGKQAVSFSNVKFYRGLVSAMAGSFPSAATFWTAYELFKGTLGPAFGPGGATAAAAASAALADVCVCVVRNPFEVIKQQMQLGMHQSTREAIASVFQGSGLRGFYAGFLPTVLREMPFDAIQFAVYETLKRHLRASKENGEDLAWYENSLLGSIAGGVSAGFTTPLDVVKTRMMTQQGSGPAAYRGVVDALRRIAAEEGAQALFKGIAPRMMWISVGGAVFIGSFEEMRRQLGRAAGCSPEER